MEKQRFLEHCPILYRSDERLITIEDNAELKIQGIAESGTAGGKDGKC